MPRYEYSRWDGSQPVQPLAAEALFDKLAESLLEYGAPMLRMLDPIEDQDADVLDQLIQEGLVERDERGQYRVSPRGIRRIEQKSLHELFQAMKKDSLGKHDSQVRGAGQVVHEDSRPYAYGDPIAHLNLHETIKNALVRQGGGSPIHLEEDDFVVHDTEYQTRCATVVLLDMSGSMARWGKFYHAKKVALALQALVRARYPQDFFQVVGFSTFASPLSERQLLDAAPKPVSLFTDRVFLRVDLDNPPSFVPEHFTNIQAGLRFARKALTRQACRNRQVIIITDGEPTAHIEDRQVVLMYPPSRKTADRTLAEVARASSEGVRVSSFALIEDYYYLGLVNFVDEMARVSKGVAAYCSAGELTKIVFDSFVGGRRARRIMG